ncbi:pyrimidine kinase [Citrobacter koseri]|uniref:Pyrimidine kinase n=1 Tax=Citrobacter koseri TaxID=545 RepID=A0A2X2XT46_CITKO|nr:pyrimidine kinase [Citrobacter koseri]
MMNDREKQILKILRRNPLIQQNEIADILQISRSRVAAHIMDLMRKGMIKGKGYILTEQEYCVVVGAINMDIRGVADIHYPQAASNPGSIHCSAGGVGRNIAHNLALLGRDVHLLSAVGSDFYGETLLEQTRQAGVNISSCIRLHGHNTSTYLSIANQQEETVLAINDTHILQQLTPQLLNSSRDLIRHAGVVLADCNLTPEAIEWVFTIADEIPVFIDTVSEFKAEKIRTWYSRIHTLKPTQKRAGDSVGGKRCVPMPTVYRPSMTCISKAYSESSFAWKMKRSFVARKTASSFYSPRRLTPVWTASARMMASWPGCSTAFWREVIFAIARISQWPARRYRAPASVLTTPPSPPITRFIC